MQSESVKKLYYLAGPMSGYPQFNYPAFFEAAKALRDKGLTILSPAEFDTPEVLEQILASSDGKLKPNLPTWGDFLSKDVKLVADTVQGIIVLPGWEKSRGARLEVFVASLCGHELCVYMERGVVRRMDEGERLRGITGVSGFQVVQQVGYAPWVEYDRW